MIMKTMQYTTTKKLLRDLCISKPHPLWVATYRDLLAVPYQYRVFGNSASYSSSDEKSFSPMNSKRTADTPSLTTKEWRKRQLDDIENKFKGKPLETISIESEEDLQPMWKGMEGRVTGRKPRSLADTGGKTGRMNIKKTEEDVWLEEGLYSTEDGDSSKK